jgi:DNA polymerase family B
VDTYKAACGFYPSRWLSAGYLAEKMLIYNNINLPYFHDIEYPVQKLALSAFYGGRIETLYKGFVGEGYENDINSAYPYAATTIPDLYQGRWVASKVVEPAAKLGFFHIIAKVPSTVRIAPFPFRSKFNMIFYPFGSFETYVTLPELKVVDAYYSNNVQYQIVEGYQFIPDPDFDEDSDYIFRDFISEQYKRRLDLKARGSPLQQALKLLLNSVYGKTAQKTKVGWNRYVMGNLYCPVIPSHITGFTRAHLLRLTHSLGIDEDVVAYATDSILTRYNLQGGLFSNDLGGIKLADHGKDLFTIQNGIKRLNGNWKLRGIGYDKVSKVPVENTATRETDDGRVVMELKRLRPVRLKSAILRGRIRDVGKFQTFTREIDLNADRKRFWPKQITSVHSDLCVGSAPLDVNLDGKLYARESEMAFYQEQEEYNPYDEE